MNVDISAKELYKLMGSPAYIGAGRPPIIGEWTEEQNVKVVDQAYPKLQGRVLEGDLRDTSEGPLFFPTRFVQ